MYVITDVNIVRLVQALQAHFEKHGNYFPVDTSVMEQAIDAVVQVGMDYGNVENRLARIMGSDTMLVPAMHLIYLSYPLYETDSGIEYALMNLNGTLHTL